MASKLRGRAGTSTAKVNKSLSTTRSVSTSPRVATYLLRVLTLRNSITTLSTTMCGSKGRNSSSTSRRTRSNGPQILITELICEGMSNGITMKMARRKENSHKIHLLQPAIPSRCPNYLCQNHGQSAWLWAGLHGYFYGALEEHARGD